MLKLTQAKQTNNSTAEYTSLLLDQGTFCSLEDFGDVFETVIILPWHVFIALKADATDVKLRRLMY